MTCQAARLPVEKVIGLVTSLDLTCNLPRHVSQRHSPLETVTCLVTSHDLTWGLS